jgi:hypothetical protein
MKEAFETTTTRVLLVVKRILLLVGKDDVEFLTVLSVQLAAPDVRSSNATIQK